MTTYSTVLTNKLISIGQSTIAESYDSAGVLPTLLLTDIGEIAYTGNNGKLNAWNGTSWNTIGIVNTSPTVSSKSNADLADDGTPTVITFYDSDAEDVPLIWSYAVTSGSLGETTVTVSGSTFTITPSTNPSDEGTFTLSFIASDGINQGSTSASYTLSLIAFGGTNYGYNAGGLLSGSFPNNSDVIDKFQFATDANATDVGDLITRVTSSSGSSSTTHGYSSSGLTPTPGLAGWSNAITKFSFATDGNATDVSNLTTSVIYATGQSDKFNSNGYVVGGYVPSITTTNIINKFPFVSSANATDAGDLTQSRYNSAGHSSDTHGYTSAGANGPGNKPATNFIDRFPFTAGGGNASDVGDLSAGRTGIGGLSSSTHGYTTNGVTNPSSNFSSSVEKFSFASSANGSTITGLNAGSRLDPSGVSSKTYGYICGGQTTFAPTYTRTASCQKIPFASDTPIATVGNLTVGRSDAAGSQY